MGIFSSNSKKEQKIESVQPQADAPKSKRELIAEKYRIMAERRQFIQEELKRVKQFQEEIKARYSKD